MIRTFFYCLLVFMLTVICEESKASKSTCQELFKKIMETTNESARDLELIRRALELEHLGGRSLKSLHGKTFIFHSPRSGRMYTVENIQSISFNKIGDQKVLRIIDGFGKGINYYPGLHTPLKVTQGFPREFPPVSTFDTILYRDGVAHPLHGSGRDLYIRDAEILQVHTPQKTEVMREGHYSVPMKQMPDGTHVIQQQAVRGCTAAASAMLAADWKAPVSLRELATRNLGDVTLMEADLRTAGLKTYMSHVRAQEPRVAEKLSELISERGSAIIEVTGEIGGHVVVLDRIDLVNRTATIRDPHHGWQITITLDALLSRYSGPAVLQVLGKM